MESIRILRKKRFITRVYTSRMLGLLHNHDWLGVFNSLLILVFNGYYCGIMIRYEGRKSI